MDDANPAVGAPAWTLGRLLTEAGLSAPLSPHLTGLPVAQVTDDSRQVTGGTCFVAVRGGRHNGSDFVESAVRAGATSVVTEEPLNIPCGAAGIVVQNSRSALARLAAAFHGLSSPTAAAPLKIVGITGTNGKSTTCELLRSILSAADERSALLGTIRYDLLSETVESSLTTPPPTVLCRHLAQAARAGARWAVMEVSSHALDQRRCDGLTFAAGVFTNISGDHEDYHGSRANYVAAKKRLFDALDESAVAVVNADDDCAESMLEACRSRVVRYGLQSAGADVTADIESLDATGSRYVITGHGLSIPIRTWFTGRYNVLNALAAAATARALGIADDAIRNGLESIAAVRGRLERVSAEGCDAGGFAVFVDYAHTDDALRCVLAALGPLTKGRVICVFGCGGDRDRTKRPRMASEVAKGADLAVVTSDNPRTEDPETIIHDLLPGFRGYESCRVEIEPQRRAAIALAIEQAQAGDTVLIAGKGHEDYQIIGTTRRHFDDAEVARACLRSRFASQEAAP